MLLFRIRLCLKQIAHHSPRTEKAFSLLLLAELTMLRELILNIGRRDALRTGIFIVSLGSCLVRDKSPFSPTKVDLQDESTARLQMAKWTVC